MKRYKLPIITILLCFVIVGFGCTKAELPDGTQAETEQPEEPDVEVGLWQSQLVRMSKKGALTYNPDESGYVIPDFSGAGYRGGGVDLPQYAVVKTISPVEGDNTAHIQAAIDEVGATPLNGGVRGAILLKAGKYPISGSIYIRHSGVVLRGEGQGGSPATSTILYATGNTPAQRDFICIGVNEAQGDVMNRWNSEGIAANITDTEVAVASKIIHLDNVSPFAKGDQIVIKNNLTQAWLDAMGGGVGTSSAPPWTIAANSIHLSLLYNRYVVSVDKELKSITMDAPFYYNVTKALTPCTVSKMSQANTVKESGIENLRIDTEYDGTKHSTINGVKFFTDENHAWNALKFLTVENCWAKEVSVQHFAGASFLLDYATRCTIESCNVLTHVSKMTGERRYGFTTGSKCQMVLFKDCYAKDGRHNYVSNGCITASGNVYLRCRSENSFEANEGHRMWSNGFLFDNFVEEGTAPASGQPDFTLGFYNRGTWGTNHGWSMVTGVAWNCDFTKVANARLVVQQPPVGQNYAIGCSGVVDGRWIFPDERAGYIEGSNRTGLAPESLYEAQLADRKRK